MKPFVLTLAGTALGLAVTLPVARASLNPTSAPSVQVGPLAPTVPVPSGTVPIPSAVPPPPTGTVSATGPLVQTRYGPVQVQVVVQGSHLLTATALRLPDADGQSRQISRYAAPLLAREALASQGQVDTVSGATWTSNGYRRSLQAALDAARAATLAPSATAGA